MDLVELGKRVTILRNKLLPGMNINQAAQVGGVSFVQLSSLESGKMNPTYKTLDKLAKRWGFSLVELISEGGESGVVEELAVKRKPGPLGGGNRSSRLTGSQRSLITDKIKGK